MTSGTQATTKYGEWDSNIIAFLVTLVTAVEAIKCSSRVNERLVQARLIASRNDVKNDM